jgi:uncharacterized protein YbjQ (UPF0145 family)
VTALFRRRSEAEKQAALQRGEAVERKAERSAESLALIEQGHIPLVATERLERHARAGEGAPATATAFSSDLEVSEWSALARLGVKPITQVMGSSIYHVAWQPTYYNVPTEVHVLSDAFNECRRLALGRLLEEAQTCGADAVVGLHIDQGDHDWAPSAVEFIAVGTAVRLPQALRGPTGAPVLSDLKGQEFVQLCQAGVRPVGIAAHTSVHYVPASGQTQMAQSGWGSSWANQELVDFSQGVYEAREKAMAFVTADVRELGGDGIIGVELREHSSTHEVTRGMSQSRDLQVTFHVMGTVVREDAALASEPAQAPPLKILSLR